MTVHSHNNANDFLHPCNIFAISCVHTEKCCFVALQTILRVTAVKCVLLKGFLWRIDFLKNVSVNKF